MTTPFPPQIYKVHYNTEKGWIGYRDDRPLHEAIHGNAATYHFRGKTAYLLIISDDSRLSRDAALRFATAITSGRFSVFNIDLSVVSAPRPDKQKGRK